MHHYFNSNKIVNPFPREENPYQANQGKFCERIVPIFKLEHEKDGGEITILVLTKKLLPCEYEDTHLDITRTPGT